MIIGEDSSRLRKPYLRESGRDFLSSGTAKVSHVEVTSTIKFIKQASS